MTACAPLHRTYENAVLAFARFLEEQAVDGMVSVDSIRSLASRLMAGGEGMNTQFAAVEAQCISEALALQMESERRNALGRIVTKRIAHLLDDPSSGVLRDHLGQLFVAIRLIMGDQVYSALQQRATAIVAEWTGADGVVAWDDFYADPRVQTIRERVRFALARAFQRFHVRKDWFLTVMNTHSSARSVGPGAFVVPDHAQPSPIPYFGESQLVRLLDSLLEK